MHPRSKQWHLIDYVIVRKRDTRDVTITKAMRGAECWTDHRLVRTLLNLRVALVQRKKPKVSREKFDIAKLKHPSTQESFQFHLEEVLIAHGPQTGDPTEQWNQFKRMMTESAGATLGLTKSTHQDWFDQNSEEISNLLDEKRIAYINWQNDPSSASKKDCFKHLQSKRPSTTPLLAADSSILLKDKDSITQRWKEHFSTLLNRPSTVDPSGLDAIPEKPALEELDLPPSLEEISRAVKQTTSGKAPGMDGIPAEFYKAAGPVALDTEALWIILSKLGCPRKFTHIIRLFHDGMIGLVLAGGDTSAPFEISNGVKQGCVLAPVLFNLFFTCVLNYALRDIDRGIYIKYRLDGSLFDLRRLSAKTKTVERLVTEALFADDCALMAHTEADLQLIVNKFAEASRLFGLTISLGKTEVLYQPSPASPEHHPPTILIGDTALKTVEHFKEDRSAWHTRTSKAQDVFETNRRDQIANAREARKAAKSSLSTTAAFLCPYCPRVCASRIGLSSHTRAHEKRLSAR
ncbi:hypothetical protein Pmani_005428 [Petrolisthes manimaculis]|uniref:Reverse transcriptase domain-containing protein n=1 Tax=Petrolisthes manimaculis TaxID=1843537 RepID=A0AAE1UM72_9EUCA|nr:hypothetical protein Pmani_005428 [Petrolisthes manimaculis]